MTTERSKNIFDKVGALIPGYRGYAERDSRRNCDKLLRNNISIELDKCSTLVNKRIKNEIKNKNLEIIQDLEECRQQINTLSDRIKYSPYGESSFFADTLIKENELEHIYKFDYEMLNMIKTFKNESNLDDIMIINSFIDSLVSLIDNRNNFIKEHK